jgi:glycerol-3-phosphate dehydrogenase (NAD(P)+)
MHQYAQPQPWGRHTDRQGFPVKEALAQIGMVVEGYVTAKAAYQLAQKHNVEMPIIGEHIRFYMREKS